MKTHSDNLSPIPILTYHQIAAAPPKGAPYRSLVVAPADFARQMAFLKLLGYRGLSMSALMPYLSGQLRGRVVGITFDDGYANNLEHALPVLQRLGFTSTCYVVSQLVGKTNVWDQAAGVASSALMDANQMRAWCVGGQEIGAHTRHHGNLTLMRADEAETEIAGSRSEIEAITGAPVHHFCYPYGAYSADHVAMVRAAGFHSATTTQRGRCQPREDLLQLPRAPVPRRVTRLALWLKLATRYEDKHRA